MIAALGSLKVTLAAFVALAAGVLAAASAESATWPLALPLALLAANLGAALACQRAFRAQLPLLVFHLALAALVALAAAGRLTYLKGRVELSTGETFTGELAQREAGPLHASRLAGISFTNEGFAISYSPGLNRNETRNRVSWREGAGLHTRTIGDQHPLTLAGYRFYTSPNKGFAPLLAWRAPDGTLHRGSLHLPSYPMHDYRQAQEWTPPAASARLWLMLDFDEVLIDPQKRSEFRLPGEHALVVRAGESRAVLKPGERIAVAGGVLAYEGLTTWMGYNVFYDWTLPWLLAAALVAVASLGWHYWRRFSARAWNE
ncbi:MAG TPA: cytochrome c biogenesis protein ResB [Burkholderiales bacterium]